MPQLVDDVTDEMLPMTGCDFCGADGAPTVERVGDKRACEPCVQTADADDDGIVGACDRCHQPWRKLDDGGTTLLDTDVTVCERCWVRE